MFIDIFQLIIGNYYYPAIYNIIQHRHYHNNQSNNNNHDHHDRNNNDILRHTDVRMPWLPGQPLQLKFPLIILMIVVCYFIQYILQDVIVAKLYSKYMIRKKHVTATMIAVDSIDPDL